MKLEELLEEFAFIIKEYALQPDDTMTKDAQELKYKIIDNVKNFWKDLNEPGYQLDE